MSRLALAKKSFDWCAFCWLPLGPVLLSVFARNDLVCVRWERGVAPDGEEVRRGRGCFIKETVGARERREEELRPNTMARINSYLLEEL